MSNVVVSSAAIVNQALRPLNAPNGELRAEQQANRECVVRDKHTFPSSRFILISAYCTVFKVKHTDQASARC